MRRASTPDYQGYYTVEQTCYGREAELGQVWTRMVFDKGGPASPDTDYMEWTRVDNGGVDLKGMQDTVASHTASINDMKPNVVIDAGELRDMEDKGNYQAIHYAMGGMSPSEFMEAYKAGRVTQALVDGVIYTINYIFMDEENYNTWITCSILDYNEWYIFEIKITARHHQEWLEVETVAETTRDINSMAEM